MSLVEIERHIKKIARLEEQCKELNQNGNAGTFYDVKICKPCYDARIFSTDKK